MCHFLLGDKSSAIRDLSKVIEIHQKNVPSKMFQANIRFKPGKSHNLCKKVERYKTAQLNQIQIWN